MIDIKNNTVGLWQDRFPRPDKQGHKYDRGHAVIFAAPMLTGATRLAATACARIGAGLTTVLTDTKGDVYRASLPPHIMVRDGISYDDARITSCLYGSGGVPEGGIPDFKKFKSLVLDAEGLTANGLDGRFVLTPHEGEFEKIFPDITGSREEKVLQAAQKTSATIVLKGAQTLISDGDHIVVNLQASEYLATAGSGDVLAGLITGLLAQGMPQFQAACAAVWIHGQASLKLGPGLVASDLEYQIPEILKKIVELKN